MYDAKLPSLCSELQLFWCKGRQSAFQETACGLFRVQTLCKGLCDARHRVFLVTKTLECAFKSCQSQTKIFVHMRNQLIYVSKLGQGDP